MPRLPQPLRLPIAALATLCAFAATTGAAYRSAAAAPPAEPAWTARSTVLMDAHAFRTASGDVVRRQRFVQHLAVAAHATDTPLDALVIGGFAFDTGLPGRPEDPLLAEHQLEPSLQVARIAWRPLASLQAQLGRHLLVSPLGLARVDGLSATLHPPQGPTATLAAGVRPEAARWTVDDWGYAPDGDPDLREAFAASALLLEARGGWNDPWFGVEAGARVEPTVDGSRRYADGVSIGARVGREDRVHGRGTLRYTPLLDAVDRAEAELQWPLGEGAGVHASALLARPIFPLDSVFAVFPVSARTELGLGGWARSSGGLTVEAVALTTGWSEHERDHPRPFGAGAEAGGEVGARIDRGRTSAGGRFRMVGSGEHHRATGLGRVAWRTGRRGPDVHAFASVLQWRDATRAVEPTGIAGWLTGGATFHLVGQSRVSTLLGCGLDHRGDLSGRGMVLLDLRLPGDLR